jgi:hypothetical protein
MLIARRVTEPGVLDAAGEKAEAPSEHTSKETQKRSRQERAVEFKLYEQLRRRTPAEVFFDLDDNFIGSLCSMCGKEPCAWCATNEELQGISADPDHFDDYTPNQGVVCLRCADLRNEDFEFAIIQLGECMWR